jgi:hypothetical protein
MILGCSNNIRLLACCLLLILLPLEVHAHVPGASREVAPTATGLNTKAPNFVLLNQLQRTLKNEHAGNVFLVSITTDPEVDSPKVLKSYAQRYGADFQNWAFLTGSEAQLKQVWKGFGVRVIKKGRGLVQHTSLTTVIDRQGIRRFNFFGEKWQLKDLLRDTSALLEEKPKHNH